MYICIYTYIYRDIYTQILMYITSISSVTKYTGIVSHDFSITNNIHATHMNGVMLPR